MNVIKLLLDRYQASKDVAGDFRYVGFRVKQDELGISVDQNEYLRNWGVEKFRKLGGPERSLGTEDYKVFKQLVGQTGLYAEPRQTWLLA